MGRGVRGEWGCGEWEGGCGCGKVEIVHTRQNNEVKGHESSLREVHIPCKEAEFWHNQSM